MSSKMNDEEKQLALKAAGFVSSFVALSATLLATVFIPTLGAVGCGLLIFIVCLIYLFGVAIGEF